MSSVSFKDEVTPSINNNSSYCQKWSPRFIYSKNSALEHLAALAHVESIAYTVKNAAMRCDATTSLAIELFIISRRRRLVASDLSIQRQHTCRLRDTCKHGFVRARVCTVVNLFIPIQRMLFNFIFSNDAYRHVIYLVM